MEHTTKYRCGNCQREYVRKCYYDKHIICCGILNQTKYQRDRDLEEYDDTPSVRQLYLLVQELAAKCGKQEKEIQALKGYVRKTKKKINILEWLNTNCAAVTDYNMFIENISVNDIHLDMVFKNDIIFGITTIIQEALSRCADPPVRCFDCNMSSFFVFSHKEKTWKILNGIDVNKMINIIQSKIMFAFKLWQGRNMKKIMSDQFKDNYYQTCVIKVMGGNLSKQTIYSKVKNGLYSQNKTQLKSITEYDFS